MKDTSPPELPRPRDAPPPSDVDESQRRILGRAVRHSDLPLKALWLHYFGLGGMAGEYELDAYINASYSLPDLQEDILAQAVNEMIDMLPPSPRACFSDDTVESNAPTEGSQG